MNKLVKILLILLVLLTPQLLSQSGKTISIQTEKGNKFIPVYDREGTIYFSIKHFAEALSIDYYQSSQTNKIELKFANYLLKYTGKSPYIVLTERVTGKQKIFQLPTSTYVIDYNVFVPLKFSLASLQIGLEKQLNLKGNNQIAVGGDFITDDKTIKTDPVNVESGKPPSTFDVVGFTLDERANGTLIRIKSNKRIPSYFSSFKDGVLTIVLRKVLSDLSKIVFNDGKGLIKKLEAKNIGVDTELKFVLGKEYTTNEVMNVDGTNDLLITLHNTIFKRPEKSDKLKEKWMFDVVVIDPGHGGKDPGAIGINGAKEKDINLAIGLKLGKLIEEKMGDVKVVYTRKNDTFVDLYKRGKIANENNGKLFISIHCNSTAKRPTDANGFEVFLLRPGRTKEAISIAETENSVIKYEENPNRYEKLTDENFILVSMAHSAYMKYSEKFAEHLHKEFSRDSELRSRGVKQAGFYVLVGASMPSVLIETGFLTNHKDAKYLSTKDGQQKFAESVFDALINYKAHYELTIDSE